MFPFLCRLVSLSRSPSSHWLFIVYLWCWAHISHLNIPLRHDNLRVTRYILHQHLCCFPALLSSSCSSYLLLLFSFGSYKSRFVFFAWISFVRFGIDVGLFIVNCNIKMHPIETWRAYRRRKQEKEEEVFAFESLSSDRFGSIPHLPSTHGWAVTDVNGTDEWMNENTLPLVLFYLFSQCGFTGTKTASNEWPMTIIKLCSSCFHFSPV